MTPTRRSLVPLACLLMAGSFGAAPGAAPGGTPGIYRLDDAGLASVHDADASRMVPATVIRIVDGDTIVVAIDVPPAGFSGRETVRLIGVDTPETVDPRKAVQRFGREADAYARSRLAGARVLLAFDRDPRDWFGRVLAYVFFEDGSCFNLELVEQGYGFAYVKYPFAFMEEFREAERRARDGKRGLWAP
ncbi:MAG: thermonuclease family protein [Spirochaetes bacterium]|nr:thermonuclease family protein [Spirochaetota bacterium]